MGRTVAQIGAIGVAIGIIFGAGEGRATTQSVLGVERVRREPAGVNDPEPLSVVVVIHDRAKVSPAVLDAAEKEVARIYLHTGLKTIWRTTPALGEGTPSQDRPLGATAFTVQLIIQATFRGQPRGTSDFLMGAAPPTTNDCAGPVYVFFDQITGVSNIQRVTPSLVLGTVIAHEVGHRLLRYRGHSSEGLMRAPWKPADWEMASLGLLLFTAAERETIRATISNCAQ